MDLLFIPHIRVKQETIGTFFGLLKSFLGTVLCPEVMDPDKTTLPAKHYRRRRADPTTGTGN
jgi:hypothetical protein